MDEYIYLRVSTDQQDETTQLKNIKEIGVPEDAIVLQEHGSAWKDDNLKKRPVFSNLLDLLKKKKVKAIWVWDLDRLYRNRKRTIEFIRLADYYGCRVYSYRQHWLKDIDKIPPPWNEIFKEHLIQIMAWIAEEESNKKSDRVKSKVKKTDDGAFSVYGSKWGRKKISRQVIEKVLLIKKENPNISIRDISKQVLKADKNNNMVPISKSVVHKILSENLGKNLTFNENVPN